MIEDLKKKTADLVINVFDLAVASNSIEDVRLEELDPEAATALTALEKEVDGVSEQVKEIEDEFEIITASLVSQNQVDMTDFMRKVNTLIDDTHAFDAQILAMPRPKNRLSKPKYFRRIRRVNMTVDGIVERIAQLKSQFPLPEAAASGNNGKPDTIPDPAGKKSVLETA
jgi:hypothetical protein